ncbi:MAG: phosphoesterase [Pirellulaceae bacterium]|jgi:predicted NUDIX family phosphoesterase|nr:phosphoesterase [Pirellulaceae bacterium]
MSLVETEHVLVVPAELLREVGYFQGFCADVDRYLSRMLQPEQISYRPRDEMEQDPSFKQLIPYVVFRYRDAAGEVSIFQYTRGAGQGESRLHQKRSVGVGGHICSDDAAVSSEQPYQEGLRRELEEEVTIDAPFSEQCVGLINDDETEVGQVHLGVVHVYDVEQPHVTPRETEMGNAGFAPASQLLTELEGFETWSQIALRAICGVEGS